MPALLGRLAERYRPRLIVIACNTASTIALPAVRAALDLPVVGTVPAIKPAAAMSKTRAIGVLGTRATVRQAYVDDLAARFAGDCRVIRHGSAELVELAEAKLRGESLSPAAFAAVLDGLFGQEGANRSMSSSTPAPIFRWSRRNWRRRRPMRCASSMAGRASRGGSRF